MSEQLVRELAQQIVKEGLLLNWVFYALLAAISLVASVASAIISTYVRKRSETYATKADLGELVSQLQVTTKAAEEVRTAIAHSDWTTREWKTLRRLKLEELIDSVHASLHWLELECNVKLFGSKVDPGPWVAPKVSRLSNLYFPELAEEASAFAVACGDYRLWILKLQGQFLDVGDDMTKRQELHSAALDEMKKVYGVLLNTAGAIETRAPDIMKDIIGV